MFVLELLTVLTYILVLVGFPIFCLMLLVLLFCSLFDKKEPDTKTEITSFRITIRFRKPRK